MGWGRKVTAEEYADIQRLANDFSNQEIQTVHFHFSNSFFLQISNLFLHLKIAIFYFLFFCHTVTPGSNNSSINIITTTTIIRSWCDGVTEN